MKVEPRGKFGGVKVHLDADECKQILIWWKVNYEKIHAHKNLPISIKLVADVAMQTAKLLQKVKDLFEDKSEDKVKEVLAAEAKKAAEKLELLQKGETWDSKKGLAGKLGK